MEQIISTKDPKLINWASHPARLKNKKKNGKKTRPKRKNN